MTPEACLQRLPPGLSITEAAKRLKLSWAKTRKLIAIHGYQFTDGRQFIGHNRRKIAFYEVRMTKRHPMEPKRDVLAGTFT